MISPPLFRARALEHYARRREQAVLPHLADPLVTLGCWGLSGVLVLAAVALWQVRVPVVAPAAGVLLPAAPGHPTANGERALLFVPADPPPTLHGGDALTLRVVLSGAVLSGTVDTILPGVLTPEEARQRYVLSGDQALSLTQPSVAVQVALPSALPADAPPGSVVSAQVPVGSGSLLSLLPHLLGGLLGG